MPGDRFVRPIIGAISPTDQTVRSAWMISLDDRSRADMPSKKVAMIHGRTMFSSLCEHRKVRMTFCRKFPHLPWAHMLPADRPEEGREDEF